MLSELLRRDSAKILVGCVALGLATWIWDWGWIPWLVALAGGGLALGFLVFSELRHTSTFRFLGGLALVTALVVGLGVAAVRWPTWLPHPGEQVGYDRAHPVVYADRDLVVEERWTSREGETPVPALAGMDLDSGDVSWRAEYDEVLGAVGRVVVVTRGDDLVAVRVDSGKPAWQLSPSGSGFDEMRVLSRDRVLMVDRGSQVRVWLVDVKSGDVVWKGPGRAVRAARKSSASTFVMASLADRPGYTVRSAETGEVVRRLPAPKAPRVVEDALVVQGQLVLRVAPADGKDADAWIGMPTGKKGEEWEIDDLGPLAEDGVLLDSGQRIDFPSGKTVEVSLNHGWELDDELAEGWYSVRSGDERGVWRRGETAVQVTDGNEVCDVQTDGHTLALTTSTEDGIGDGVTVLDVVSNGHGRPIQLGADGFMCPILADGILIYGTSTKTYAVPVEDLF